LDKALWQRDLICSLQALLHCQALDQDAGHKARWDGAKNSLLDCLEQVVFTPTEYDELQSQLPLSPSPAHVDSTCRYLLAEDYLPPVVFARPANWYELPSDEEPGLHFQAYGGRSFIRIFTMVPGMSRAEFLAYWAKVTKRFGMN